MLRAVAEQGYTQPTPIQAQAIPEVLAGRDLLAAAQTGTGKTAGFVLPILQRLSSLPDATSTTRRPLRVLVLTPTRELAAQVEESVRTYGAHLAVKSVAVFGGVGIVPQIQTLKRGVDILVATPGRLLDHVQQRTVDLSKVEIVVLDEADRMLDMGFIRDIRRILGLLPAKRQSLLFSATFSPEIRSLAETFLVDPAVVEVARRNAPSDLVTQVVHPVDAMRKRELLAHLISSGDWKQVLVFTKTKHGANRLAQQLERDGITAAAIHGNKSQSHRTRTLADFKRGDLRVMVATDIAARGLDIEELPHVVNYDLSHVPEDYVHRIGRTGRAGSEGEAVSLVCSAEIGLLGAIERLLKRTIEQRVVSGFEPGTAVHRGEPEARHSAPRRSAGQGQSRNQTARGSGPVPRRAADRGGRSGQPSANGNNKAGTPAESRSRRGGPTAPAGQTRPGQDPQRKSHNPNSPGSGSSRPGRRGAVPALLGGGRYQDA